MKHRYAVLGAVAIGLMIAFLLVGRVRASEPAAHTWSPEAVDPGSVRLDGARPWTADEVTFEPHRSWTRPPVPR